MLTYTDLKTNPREFLAATSLTVAEFEELLPAFHAAYAARYPAHLTAVGQPRQPGPGSAHRLPPFPAAHAARSPANPPAVGQPRQRQRGAGLSGTLASLA